MLKRFLFRLLVFLALPLPLLYALSNMVDEGLRRSDSDLFEDWNALFQGRIRADVIVMGSSRSRTHISPRILDSTLHVSSYNLGLDGWGGLMQLCRFKVLLGHNPPPKYVVYSVDIYTLTKRINLFKSAQFLPYINEPLIRQYTSGYTGSFDLAQRYFPLYKYNNQPDVVLEGLYSYYDVKKYASGKYKGYKGYEREWDFSFDEFVRNNPHGLEQYVDPGTVGEFDEFLQYCRDNRIAVIFVFAPEYIEGQKMTTNREQIMGIYRRFSEQYGIPFLNYSDDPMSHDKSLFYNSQHLNRNGAEQFSRKLAGDLRPLIH